MQQLTPDASLLTRDIAHRHGVSEEAALTLLRAIVEGGGARAQFSHPELGGMGQWSSGGMVQIGAMFDAELKARVDALARELAELAPAGTRPAGAMQSQAQRWRDDGPADTLGAEPEPAGGAWWPAGLGPPSAAGSQDEARYALFPAHNRLAIEAGGRVSLYDTGDHRITGVSQGGGGDGPLMLSSETGRVALADLTEVPTGAGASRPTEAVTRAGAAAPAVSPSASGGGDAIATIERLADLHAKGILNAEEFAAKKAELLARL